MVVPCDISIFQSGWKKYAPEGLFPSRRASRTLSPSKLFGTGRSGRTARIVFAAGALGALAAFASQFLAGQFAIAVLVELAQGGGGVVDFIGVNDAIAIGVERGDDWISFAAT